MVSTIHEIANSTISIYPNPTISEINIDVSGELQYETLLYNLSGKLILNSINEKVLSVSSLPQGTYMLEIKDLESGQKIVEKIFVGK